MGLLRQAPAKTLRARAWNWCRGHLPPFVIDAIRSTRLGNLGRGRARPIQLDEPFLAPSDKLVFREALDSARVYLEYGAGGSTVWAARQVSMVVVVDSHKHDARCRGRAGPTGGPRADRPDPWRHRTGGRLGRAAVPAAKPAAAQPVAPLRHPAVGPAGEGKSRARPDLRGRQVPRRLRAGVPAPPAAWRGLPHPARRLRPGGEISCGAGIHDVTSAATTAWWSSRRADPFERERCRAVRDAYYADFR